MVFIWGTFDFFFTFSELSGNFLGGTKRWGECRNIDKDSVCIPIFCSGLRDNIVERFGVGRKCLSNTTNFKAFTDEDRNRQSQVKGLKILIVTYVELLR